MSADDLFGPIGDGGDFVDVQGRGIGGEDGAGPTDRIQLGEDFLLQVQVFEHGFDDDVGVLDVGDVGDALDQP